MQTSLDFWILQSIAMLFTVILIPRLRLTGVSGVVLMIVGLGLVNTYLWDPQLFSALPDTLSSRAVLLLFVNGLIFFALVKLLPGIEIEGVMPAIAAPIVFTLSGVLIKRYGSEIDWENAFVTSSAIVTEVFQTLRAYFRSS